MKGCEDGLQYTAPTCDDPIADREHGLKAKAKKKAKSLLHIQGTSDEVQDDEHHAALDELENSPAFNTSKVLNRARVGSLGITSKAIGFVRSTASAIIHPKTALKTRATRKTAGTLAKSRPYLSRQADLDFLEAHDDLQKALGMRDGNDTGETAEDKRKGIDQCEEHLENLERTRQNMRVAWVTARHVQRVRVVDAITPQFPEDNFFEQEDDCGFTEFNWGKWLAYVRFLNHLCCNYEVLSIPRNFYTGLATFRHST